MTAKDISPALGWDDVYIVTTRDGSDTLYSRSHDALYHSAFGAVSESKHVFIQHGLITQLEKPSISILEFGFGTGLNAFLSYLNSLNKEKELHYTGIEAFPISIEIASKLTYPEYLAFIEEREIFHRMHTEADFVAERFHFSKFNSIIDLPADSSFDCVFFDAFAPGAQPELWEQSMFDALFHLVTPKGCIVTYCAQGEARRRMQSAGFQVERLSGPPGKREMLRGSKT